MCSSIIREVHKKVAQNFPYHNRPPTAHRETGSPAPQKAQDYPSSYRSIENVGIYCGDDRSVYMSMNNDPVKSSSDSKFINYPDKKMYLAS